jgi:hypothetical protein
MEDRDRPKDLETAEAATRRYDPPQADVVPVRLEDRVLGCNFSTISVCELTE